MPSSDPTTIPKVIELVQKFFPYTVLDVGIGNGRYGLLFREILDLNLGNLKKDSWQAIIDGVEIEKDYINPAYGFYTNTHMIDFMDFTPTHTEMYDFLFMGDVLEHFEDWQAALEKARSMSLVCVVVAPNWKGSIGQGAWYGYESECHRVALTPEMVGGRCVFASSKCFISVFGRNSLLESRDLLL